MIKKHCILSIILLSSLTAMCQYVEKNVEKDVLKYYNEGVNAFYKNDIIAADSLFQKSISVQITLDGLYNHAQTRLLLNDTCKACHDLVTLNNVYNDVDGIRLFSKVCVLQSDTTYYDKNFTMQTSANGCKYYEVFQRFRCDSMPLGEIHKIGHNATKKLNIMNFREIQLLDLYANYRFIDSTKYYNFVYSSGFNSQNNKYDLEIYSNKVRKYLNIKYDFSNIPANKRSVYLETLINSTGNIVSCKVFSDNFNELDKTTHEAMDSDISNFFKQIPPLSPERLLNRPVAKFYKFCFDINTIPAE